MTDRGQKSRVIMASKHPLEEELIRAEGQVGRSSFASLRYQDIHRDGGKRTDEPALY